MSDLSVEDKAKGKRIITQFFRTMPGVQKNLMHIFEKDGYKGVFWVQHLLYPNTSQEINSIDTLRKGLSMILQHIYGMPVENKEGYFQDILKCKTASQVIRREKETLLNYFYSDLPALKTYFLHELVEDRNYRMITMICQKFLGEEETVSDMRSFKNQIRNVRETLGDEVAGGTSEEELIELIKERKAELATQAQAESESAAEAVGGENLSGEAKEKHQIIMNTLDDAKYQDIRQFLLQKTVTDPKFATFQQYLDNVLSPSSRLVANDMNTFSEGVKKIKEFRDNLEKELLSSTN